MHDPVLPQAGCLLELPRERGNLSAQMGVQARRGSPGVVIYFRCYIKVNILKQQFFSNISPDIGVVNTVAIHILVTDSADTVTALTLKILV